MFNKKSSNSFTKQLLISSSPLSTYNISLLQCNREIAASRDGSDSMSFKRHSKSTFDSGFESGLSDILDEILGGGNYDPVLEEAMVSCPSELD